MKPRVQVIARREADFGRANRSEGFKIFKNTDPSLHPLAQQTEYVRAIRAAKMKKMFAKPFIGSLEGHSESVYSLCRHHKNTRTIISGGADGEIRIWDLSTRSCMRTIKAHPLTVNDVSCSPNSDLILSVGSDGNVCGFSESSNFAFLSPSGALQSIDHSYSEPMFVTGGATIDLWSPQRNSPIQTFDVASTKDFKDTVFNMNETNLIATCAGDCSIMIADTRTRTIARKIRMSMQSNAVDWNPQAPFYFISANDDSACYLFDIRKTESAVRVYTDHLDPVTCISFSPNGKQFVTGSYDSTVRIWDWENIKSRDCYHTQRMQRVFCVCVSPDSKYALCGSEDMNIRIFKTKANEMLQSRSKKEERAQDYQERLLKKWRFAPEVRAISEKQNLPKKLHKKRFERAKMMEAYNRKALSRMAHAKNPESEKPQPLRERRVVLDEA